MPEKSETKPVLDGEALERLERTVNQVRKEISALTEPIRKSAQLTEDDYSIRINARD